MCVCWCMCGICICMLCMSGVLCVFCVGVCVVYAYVYGCTSYVCCMSGMLMYVEFVCMYILVYLCCVNICVCYMYVHSAFMWVWRGVCTCVCAYGCWWKMLGIFFFWFLPYWLETESSHWKINLTFSDRFWPVSSWIRRILLKCHHCLKQSTHSMDKIPMVSVTELEYS